VVKYWIHKIVTNERCGQPPPSRYASPTLLNMVEIAVEGQKEGGIKPGEGNKC
jgi:hypothetical protein